jgi:hypothetical protein
MQETSKITNLMLKDHLRLLSILHKLETSEEFEEKTKIFTKLKEDIEKHFFIEEKTIFSDFSVRKDESAVYNLFLELAKQHTNILNLLESINKDLKNNISPNSLSIRDNLISHQRFEEKLIYPKFDKELDDNQKEMIFARIQDIM